MKPCWFDFGLPEPQKSMFSLRECATFRKTQISKESSKSTLRGAPGPPKRRPKSTPGRPLIDVNGLQISTWAPPGAVKYFFRPRRPPRAAPRGLRARSGSRVVAQEPPRSPQDAILARIRTLQALIYSGFLRFSAPRNLARRNARSD